MTYQTLFTSEDLYHYLDDPGWVIVDCRFSLADTEYGRQEYLKAHIPGAVYAHLNEDLSRPVVPGVTGRHPLPNIEKVSEVFSRLGINAGTQVVAYDDAGGALAAVRLWWLLRWLGHEAVAVLDGGWQAWLRRRFPVKAGNETRAGGNFIPSPHPEMIATAADVENMHQDARYRLVDARTTERYLGEIEPIDTVAGHIPGAINAPYINNLTPDGYFLPPQELRKIYERVLAGVSPKNAVLYCGSGVTAIHDVLAMVHAGLDEPRLYAGSWSEWITDPNRPIATKEPG